MHGLKPEKEFEVCLMKKWYSDLIEKVKKIYSQLVVIKDSDLLGSDENLLQELSLLNYALTEFYGELSLRRFIRQHKTQQILIFLRNEGLYFPFDIQRNADLISWSMTDVFPRLNSNELKEYRSEDFQSIYEMYQSVEQSLGLLDELETKFQIAEWIKAGKISVRAKIYSADGGNKGSEFLAKENYSEVKCSQLLKQLNELFKNAPIRWGDVAKLCGELQSYHPSELRNPKVYNDLDRVVEKNFTRFIINNYDQLFFASFKNGPVMINQTMSYLAMLNSSKIALLCFDGMGFAEWQGLRKYLKIHQLNSYKEQEVFALIPTLTSVSRAALFSGEPAMERMGSETTGFYNAVETLFKNGKSRTKFLFKNTDAKWNPYYLNYEVLGIIFNIIDHVGHNTVLLTGSKKNMHLQLDELYQESQIAQTIKNLLDEEYRVFITADHGSVWCCGNGIISDKYLVEEQARRALVYPNNRLAEDFARDNDVLLWENQRILGGKVLALTHNREMFGPKNKMEISHGGINIEEVIIPFVEVLQ